MSNDPITTRLLREAERATLRMDDDLAAVLREAAEEIERLEKRSEPTIWIARDSDGSLAMYQTQPTYSGTGAWEPTGDDPTIEFVELGPMKWPDIEPASCVKFEMKELIQERVICPCCLGTGSVYVDFEHPQWVRCGCSAGAEK